MFLLANVGLIAILSAAVAFLPPPPILPCTYPLAASSLLAIGAALIVQVPLAWKFRSRPALWVTALEFGLMLLILGLGSYAVSPLGFSTGRVPAAQGFVVTRSMRPDSILAPGGTIEMVGGSVIAIHAVTLPVSRRCTWISTKGAALDDSGDCDIDYTPPGRSDVDLLRVLVQPACGLPQVEENIKVMVLP